MMINTSKTFVPEMEEKKETDHGICDLPRGSIIGDGYVVGEQFVIQGKQSNVFMVRRDGKNYVAKLYHPQCQPVERIRDYLGRGNHKNLVDTLDNGRIKGYYYEIYSFFQKGTLEDRKNNTQSFVQKSVIPSVNEGLRELHTQGIIHCDIKPSNLFVADDEHICIGDFGSCVSIGADGTATIVLHGTPEYSAPVTSFYGQATITPAYDYCSFGLVIYRLLTGKSLLGNLKMEEIARAWQKGFQLPSDISSRMAELIRGLIDADPDKRWGYVEVKRWIDNEFIADKNTYTRPGRRRAVELRPLIFGKINDEMVSVTSVSELVSMMKQHWDHAKTIVRRIDTEYFLRQFNPEYTNFLRTLKTENEEDLIVFKLIYYLEMDENLYFRGKNYGPVMEYIENLKASDDKDAIDLITTGLFVYYLKMKNEDIRMIDRIERIVRHSVGNSVDIEGIGTICDEYLS